MAQRCGNPTNGAEPLLVIIGVLIALTVAVTISRVRVPGGVKATQLGWMSAQWLAEHRMSHPS